jgi:hypothetical protein
MDDFSIKFQGFHPSDFTRSYLHERLSELQDEAPYGSTVHAIFTRKKEQLKGIVSIHSSAGRFFAMASGSKVKDVGKKLVEQIRKQLDKWKSLRFEHRSIRELPYEKDIGA